MCGHERLKHKNAHTTIKFVSLTKVDVMLSHSLVKYNIPIPLYLSPHSLCLCLPSVWYYDRVELNQRAKFHHCMYVLCVHR